jgi:hypothetical protein
MKYRKLRIAWSVGWGILCLLLIVLWVRSLRYCESLHWRANPERVFVIASLPGSFVFVRNNGNFLNYPNWHLQHHKVSELDWEQVERFDNEQTVFQLRPMLRVVDGHSTGIHVHYAFVAVMTVAICAAPWFKWQFSLRTLLIGITLVAVGLGLVVYALRS